MIHIVAVLMINMLQLPHHGIPTLIWTQVNLFNTMLGWLKMEVIGGISLPIQILHQMNMIIFIWKLIILFIEFKLALNLLIMEQVNGVMN